MLSQRCETETKQKSRREVKNTSSNSSNDLFVKQHLKIDLGGPVGVVLRRF